MQNCAFLRNEDFWGDYLCDYTSYACMCTHKQDFYLELKGVLPSSMIDRYYKPISNSQDRRVLRFQGLDRTMITYNEEKEIWILDVAASAISGISKASHASFILGRHTWEFTGVKGFSNRVTKVRELKMSGCAGGNFTCNDGQCVSMSQRCNQLPECSDESDERNCQTLVLKEGYNKEVPPINSSDPVDVSVFIDLMKIGAIDERDYSIEMQFEVSLKWKEKGLFTKT